MVHLRACVNVSVRCFVHYCCDGLTGRDTLSFAGHLKEAEGKELGVLFWMKVLFHGCQRKGNLLDTSAKPQIAKDENGWWWWCMNDEGAKPISALFALNNKEYPGCTCKMLVHQVQKLSLFRQLSFKGISLWEKAVPKLTTITQLCNFGGGGGVWSVLPLKHWISPACLESAIPDGYRAPSSAVYWFHHSGEVLLIRPQWHWGDRKPTFVRQHGEGA